MSDYINSAAQSNSQPEKDVDMISRRQHNSARCQQQCVASGTCGNVQNFYGTEQPQQSPMMISIVLLRASTINKPEVLPLPAERGGAVLR